MFSLVFIYRTKKTTAIKLVLVWLLAILIACPVFIHASMDNKSIYISNICGMNNLAFQVKSDARRALFYLIFRAYQTPCRQNHGLEMIGKNK